MRYSTLGASDLDTSAQRAIPEVIVVDYEYDDLDENNLLDVMIPANSLVTAVIHKVETAFSGGSPALTVGDGSDADGYLTAADTLITSGSALAVSTAAARALAAGKFYSTDGVVRLTHAASLAAGAGKVLVVLIPLSGNWRLPAL